MENDDEQETHEAITITDDQLLEFWGQLGVVFKPEIEPSVAAQFLRALENNLTMPVWEKMEIIAGINEVALSDLVSLFENLETGNTKIIEQPEIAVQRLREGLELLQNNLVPHIQINLRHFWCSYLLTCYCDESPSKRFLTTNNTLVTELLNKKLYFISYCIGEILCLEADIFFTSGHDCFLIASIQAYTNLAETLYQLNDFDYSLSVFKKVLIICYSEPTRNRSEYDALRAMAHMNLGNVRGTLGQLEESLASFDAALDLYNSNSLLNRFDLDSDRAKTHMNYGNALTELGRLEEALNSFKTALKLYCGDTLRNRHDLDVSRAKIHTNLGIVLANLGRFEDAIDSYNLTLAIYNGDNLRNRSVLDDNRASVYLNLCKALAESGRLEEALASCDAALYLYESDSLNERIELNANRALTNMNRGNVLAGLGRLEEALTSSKIALQLYYEDTLIERIDLDGARALTHMNIGGILLGLGRLDESLAAYDTALTLYYGDSLRERFELDDDRALTYLHRGLTTAYLGRIEDALESHAIALSLYYGDTLCNRTDLDSSKARAHMNFGYILSDIGRSGEALESYQIALTLYYGDTLRNRLDLDSNRAKTHMNYGIVLVDLGRFEEAFESYDTALSIYNSDNLLNRFDLDESRAHVNTNYGNALAVVNRTIDALASYNAAFRLLCNERLRPQNNLDTHRFSLSYNTSLLLNAMPDPHSWASERSQFLVSRMDMIPLPGTQDPYEWRHNEMRKYFVLFHARWLRFSLENGDFDTLPSILLALQGRKLASAMLDELDRSGLETDAPEAVRQIKQARIAIRKLDEEIRGIIGDHPYHRDGDDGLRAFMPDLRPALPPETQSKLEAKQRQRQEAFEAYLLLRAEVAQLPDYQLLQCHGDRLNGENLRQTLLPQQALALLLDLRPDDDDRKPLQGVLLLRPHASATWLPMDGLDALALQVAAFNEEMQGRGFRRSRDAAQPTDLPPLLAAPDRFWQELASALSEQFWQPLLPYLADCRELTVIGHGRLHLLPLECGAPDTLTLRHYPGLVFYAQHQGLLGDRPANTESLPKTLGILSDSGDAHDPIPLAHAEAQLLKALWEHHGLKALIEGDENVSLADILATPADKMPPDVVHLACHGSGQDPHHADDLARLKLGSQTIHMPWLLAQGQQPRTVILAACLAGQTKEDMDGDPLGLVSGWFIKKTRHLTASISPLPDLWLPLFSGLLHQALLDNPQGGLPTALAVAKRRIASGDWAQDDILSALVKQHVAATLKTHYLKTASQYANPPNWQALWKQLEPELAKHGCTDAQLLPLHKYQTENPKPDLNKVAKFCGLCGQAVTNALLDSPIPPPDCLGIFRFAVRCYG